MKLFLLCRWLAYDGIVSIHSGYETREQAEAVRASMTRGEPATRNGRTVYEQKACGYVIRETVIPIGPRTWKA